MGNKNLGEAAPKKASPPSKASKDQKEKRISRGEEVSERLLDKYTLGKMLGQGAFGIVYECRLNTAPGEKYAVKMIDPIETSMPEIKQEVEMLRLLAHPCVVAMREVFYEKVFVCLVMEIYKGGDMIEGMQLHWKEKGKIPIPVIQNVSKMMVQAVDWLHENSIVHRDLKGDNFLMSVINMEDQKCRVYMSDFGTVVALSPGERLNQKCGTKHYWSPEFYGLDYSLGVDIWAIGIIMFGLVTGRFPFKDGQDVKKKTEIKLPSRVTPDGDAFIKGCLIKNENERFDSKKAIEHAFMASIKSAAEVEDAAEERDEATEDSNEVKEKGANAGVDKRRRDLVQRLEDRQNNVNAPGKQKVQKPMAGIEVFHKRSERTVKFEWWATAKYEKAQFVDMSKTSKAKGNSDAMTRENIVKMLEEHSVSTAAFGQGQAKKLPEFVEEVQNGQTRLMLDATKHKNMVRVIDLVVLRIVHGTGANKRFLIKLAEKFPDGRIRDMLNQMPGTKKRPHENGIMVCERLIAERLQMTECKVVIDVNNKEYLEEDEESPSYPGVRTVYRKEIYEGIITTTDKEKLQTLGIDEVGRSQYVTQDLKNYTRTFGWFSEGACVAKGIKFEGPKQGYEVSPLVPIPVGYDEEELVEFLVSNEVDVTNFAKDGKGSLAKLSEELLLGNAVLTHQPDGKIMRLVDVIVLKINKKNGDTLVQASEKTAAGTSKKERLPGVKRRHDENRFWAAHRVLDEVLQINENLVRMDHDNTVLIEEEKPSEAYSNLPTMYRRYIVPCTLVED